MSLATAFRIIGFKENGEYIASFLNILLPDEINTDKDNKKEKDIIVIIDNQISAEIKDKNYIIPHKMNANDINLQRQKISGNCLKTENNKFYLSGIQEGDVIIVDQVLFSKFENFPKATLMNKVYKISGNYKNNVEAVVAVKDEIEKSSFKETWDKSSILFNTPEFIQFHLDAEIASTENESALVFAWKEEDGQIESVVIKTTGEYFFWRKLEIGAMGSASDYGMTKLNETGFLVSEKMQIHVSKDWETGIIDDYHVNCKYRKIDLDEAVIIAGINKTDLIDLVAEFYPYELENKNDVIEASGYPAGDINYIKNQSP